MNDIGLPKLVMVIDDDAVVRDVVSGVLALRRLQPLAASGIAQAQELLLRHGDVPVIVVDIHMPEMNGLDVIETLSRQVPKETAFIVLTADIRQSTAVEALRRQAFDFLRKPVDARDLLAAIDGAFQHVAERRADTAHGSELEKRHKELLDKAQKISGALLTSEGSLKGALMVDESRSHENGVETLASFTPMLDLSEKLRQELSQSGRLGNLSTADDLVEAGRRLLAVFQTILDARDADSGNLELDLAPIDLGPIVKRAVEPYQTKARQRGLIFKLYVQSHLPKVNGDRRRIAHLLDQLVANAVKFSVDGSKIIVSAVHFDNEVIMSVRDFGIGMAPEQVARAREPFQGTDDPPARRAEGLGTGLTIAKVLADLHGGRFEIDSALGQGTTVRIHLPVPSEARRPAVA